MCLGSGAAFGAMAIFGKLAYGEGASVGTLLAMRFILGALAFWAIVFASDGVRELRALPRRDVKVGLALGGLGYAAQAACFFAALERIDASLLSLLLYTFPTMVAIAAVALGRERFEFARLIALALASTGLILVLAGARHGSIDPVGTALALGAALVYTTYILSSQRVASAMSPQLLAALVCSGAAVSLTLASSAIGAVQPGELTAAGWGWIGALTLVSTVIAITLFFAGLRRVGPTAASILATVEPVVTVFLAFVVFDEVLRPAQVVGAALVLAAVPVLEIGSSKRRRNGVSPSSRTNVRSSLATPAAAPTSMNAK